MAHLVASWQTVLGILSDQLLWWAVKLLPDGHDRNRLAEAVMRHYQRLYEKGE